MLSGLKKMASSLLLLMKVLCYVGVLQLIHLRLEFCLKVQSLSMMPFVTLVVMSGLDNLEATDNMGTCQLAKVLGVNAQVLGGNLNK